MSLFPDPSAAAQSLRTSSATPAHGLGEKLTSTGGRIFRYCKAGASALVVGDVIQAPAVVANHQVCAVAAGAALGAKQITVTLGATAATANQYAGGFVTISDADGAGYTYGIKSHPAADASASLVLTLYDDDPVAVALTTSSKADLTANPYNGVIQAPVTTLTNVPVGVAVYPISAGEYGWIQTRGPVATSLEGTPIVGSLVAVPSDTAGQAGAFSGVLPFIGYMLQVGVDEKKKAVFLALD